MMFDFFIYNIKNQAIIPFSMCDYYVIAERSNPTFERRDCFAPLAMTHKKSTTFLRGAFHWTKLVLTA